MARAWCATKPGTRPLQVYYMPPSRYKLYNPSYKPLVPARTTITGALEHFYLTQSVVEVVSQKQISPQIRRLIPFISHSEK